MADWWRKLDNWTETNVRKTIGLAEADINFIREAEVSIQSQLSQQQLALVREKTLLPLMRKIETDMRTLLREEEVISRIELAEQKYAAAATRTQRGAFATERAQLQRQLNIDEEKAKEMAERVANELVMVRNIIDKVRSLQVSYFSGITKIEQWFNQKRTDFAKIARVYVLSHRAGEGELAGIASMPRI